MASSSKQQMLFDLMTLSAPGALADLTMSPWKSADPTNPTGSNVQSRNVRLGGMPLYVAIQDLFLLAPKGQGPISVQEVKTKDSKGKEVGTGKMNYSVTASFQYVPPEQKTEWTPTLEDFPPEQREAVARNRDMFNALLALETKIVERLVAEEGGVKVEYFREKLWGGLLKYDTKEKKYSPKVYITLQTVKAPGAAEDEGAVDAKPVFRFGLMDLKGGRLGAGEVPKGDWKTYTAFDDAMKKLGRRIVAVLDFSRLTRVSAKAYWKPKLSSARVYPYNAVRVADMSLPFTVDADATATEAPEEAEQVPAPTAYVDDADEVTPVVPSKRDINPPPAAAGLTSTAAGAEDSDDGDEVSETAPTAPAPAPAPAAAAPVARHRKVVNKKLAQ